MQIRFACTAAFALAFAMLLPVEASALPAAGAAVKPSASPVDQVEKVGYRYNRRYYRDRGSYVRAPFTEVDTRRGTWVAAPFARVYSGRRGTWVRAPFVNLWVPR